MMLMTLLAACPETASSCSKCPSHAIAALAGALVVGLLIGFFVGRAGKKGAAKKSGCKCAKSAKGPGEPRARIERPAPARQPVPAGSVEIYVGNLSYDMKEEDMRKLFEAHGKVDSARIVVNGLNGKSKGFGFVVMPNRPEAEAAIAALNDKDVMGRPMRCNEAKNTIKEN